MTSPDLTASNVDKIAELFPGVITETVDADGNPVSAVDFDLLRQELSDHVVKGPQERYQLDWPGKRAAAFAANAPIAKTLRPVREESSTSTPRRTSSSRATTSTRSSCSRSRTSARSS